MTTKLLGRPTIVLRLVGREDGSILKLFRRAVMTLVLSGVVTEKELWDFCNEAENHWDSWENLIDYIRGWMVIE